METILSFLGFSLGASLGAGLVNAMSRGIRPLARETIRAGLTAGDAVSSAAGWVRETASSAAQEARAETDGRAETVRVDSVPKPRRRRPRSEAHRIEIERED